MSLANSALRSIIRQMSIDGTDPYGIAHLRGQIHAINMYLEPDEALVNEAIAALDELRRRAKREPP